VEKAHADAARAEKYEHRALELDRGQKTQESYGKYVADLEKEASGASSDGASAVLQVVRIVRSHVTSGLGQALSFRRGRTTCCRYSAIVGPANGKDTSHR
jgi:hypothetical protein